MAPKKIFLWSTQRTLSMAFQRSIYQLDRIKHFCEPFALPHYFGANKMSVQFSNEPEVEKRIIGKRGKIPTHDERLQEIVSEYEGYDTNFIKEHAMYAWPDVIPKEIMQSSYHTFIIRTPEKAIKSVYRQTLASFKDSVWSHIVPEELGFKEQLLMYTFVTEELKMDAMVIDAEDLMKKPKQVLEKYCSFVGLHFDECMLDWSKDDTKTEEKPWDFLPNSWIKDVKETRGFRKEDKVQDIEIEYPEFIYDAISENMTYYETLKRHKLVV